MHGISYGPYGLDGIYCNNAIMFFAEATTMKCNYLSKLAGRLSVRVVVIGAGKEVLLSVLSAIVLGKCSPSPGRKGEL